jgi:phosphomannomutase
MTYKNDFPINFLHSFKDADIRGRYGDEINESLTYAIARAFVEVAQTKKVIVGRDMRLSSPALANAFIAGVVDAGAVAIDVGLVTTPMMYFLSGKKKLPGAMITASHNPKQYNGIKLVFSGAVPLTTKNGLRTIQNKVKKNVFSIPKRPGKIQQIEIAQDFFSFIKKKYHPPRQKTVKVAVDIGNGMGALLVPLLEQYAIVTPIFYEMDGNFPNRDSNPTLKKSQRAITEILKKGEYDFGIAFDGDADRVAVFDEKGNYINAAHVGAFLADTMLVSHSKSSFIYTILTSRIYKETVINGGGKAVRARVGHAFIKESMRKNNALFGCEHSAHFYFKQTFYADSVTIPVLLLINACASQKKNNRFFSDIISPYLSYFQTEEILVVVNDKDAALQKITDWGKSMDARISQFDGVSIDNGEWWAAIKKSVTEDAIKFVVESKNKKTAQQMQRYIKDLLIHS